MLGVPLASAVTWVQWCGVQVHECVALGLGQCGVLLAQVTGIHSIDNCEGTAEAARAFGVVQPLRTWAGTAGLEPVMWTHWAVWPAVWVCAVTWAGCKHTLGVGAGLG